MATLKNETADNIHGNIISMWPGSIKLTLVSEGLNAIAVAKSNGDIKRVNNFLSLIYAGLYSLLVMCPITGLILFFSQYPFYIFHFAILLLGFKDNKNETYFDSYEKKYNDTIGTTVPRTKRQQRQQKQKEFIEKQKEKMGKLIKVTLKPDSGKTLAETSELTRGVDVDIKSQSQYLSHNKTCTNTCADNVINKPGVGVKHNSYHRYNSAVKSKMIQTNA